MQNIIKIICGESINQISKSVIKEINYKDLSSKNIIIVPDSYSLIMEKMIFEVLGIESTINISVLGITKLANLILEELKIQQDCYSQKESFYLVRRAIQKNADSFFCFNKNINMGLCDEIFKNIMQLKASNIETDEFKNSYNGEDVGLVNKIHDISLIYNSYEKLLKDKIDMSQALNIFSENICRSDIIKNTNFFITGFNNMTKQGYNILKNLMKGAKSSTIGVLKISRNASFIQNEMYENIMGILQQNSLSASAIVIPKDLNEEKSVIFNNVFKFTSKQKIENGQYVKVIESNDTISQIEYIAKNIIYSIKTKNSKFSDFSICANGAEWSTFKNVFNRYEIPIFCDEEIILKNTILGNFITDVLNCIEKRFDYSLFNRLINSDFVSNNLLESGNIINAINKYGDINSKFLEKELDDKALDLIKKLKHSLLEIKNEIDVAKTMQNFFNIIISILEKFEIKEKLDILIENFKMRNELVLEKTYIQLYDALLKEINSITGLIRDEEISFSDFINFFDMVLEKATIKNIPMSIGCVFLGDLNSFYDKTKTLFIVNANEGTFPETLSDTGLINDFDIEKMSQNILIDPTVKTINIRNKLKVFELLTIAEDRLFVLYRGQTADGQKDFPSGFVTDILNIYSYKNFIDLKTINQILPEIEDNFADKINFNLASQSMAKINLNSFGNEGLSSFLKNILSEEKDARQSSIEIDYKSLFFKNNTSKVSQLEKYFTCPHSHLLKYGLKLKENKISKLKANDFGNFIHEFAEKLIKTNPDLGHYSDDEIKTKADNIFKNLCDKDVYYMVNLKENTAIKKLIKKELLRLCVFINNEQKFSLFKPKFTEISFSKDSIFKPLSLDLCEGNFSLVGVVDRIDICGNDFRIIDYKTGSGKIDNTLASVFFGKKIQTFIYILAVSQNINEKCFGGFYFPIRNTFSQENEEYKLKGYFINDPNLVLKADSTLCYENNKSSFFGASISASKKNMENGEIIVNKSGGALEKEDFDAICDYVKQLSVNAILEIINGNIKPLPYEGACSFCEFKDVCKNSGNENIIRNLNFKICNDSFKIKGAE